MDLINEIIEILLYVFIGFAFCLAGYKILELMYKKHFNLSEEVDNQNTAIGVMLFGFFIAIGIIMMGVM